MPTNDLLDEKYRAQRGLAAQGGDDLHAYARHIHEVARDVEQRFNLRFRYGRVVDTPAAPPAPGTLSS